MRRRELMLMLSGGMLYAPAPRAQQKAMRVVGYLNISQAPSSPVDLSHDLVHEGLSERGYFEGQNMTSEYRWAGFHYDRLPALAADLVSRKVDVIVALGGTPTAIAAKSATSTIPIVFVNVGDPVGVGLVASLARPGGNLTGFANISLELTPKRLELLSELIPHAQVIALLVNTNNNAYTEPLISAMQQAARARGLRLPILKASSESEIDKAFAALAQLQAGGLVVGADPFFNSRRELLLALASRHAVPAIYERREYAVSGGLITYGPSLAVLTDMDRHAGIYAGSILKGANPADLPVEQPTKFELVVNLATAKALALTIPQSILARADEVIE